MSDVLDAVLEESSTPSENTEGQAGQPRDDAGRFAAKAAEPPKTEAQPAQPAPAPVAQQQPAPTPAPVPQPEPAKAEPGHVPISALLDEREKRQKLEKRLADFEQQTRQPESAPSFQTPEDIASYVQQQARAAEWNATVRFSEHSARKDHGDEAVDAAIKWSLERADREKAQLGFSPFAVEQMRQQHPLDWVVRQHKRDTFAAEIGDDPAAYRAKVRAELEAEIAASTQAPQPAPAAAAPPQPAAPKPPPPVRSIAGATSAGGMQSVPTGPGKAFDAAF